MSSLDESVTLEDVLAVVLAKRVPLAAELAGYLALEVAEGADPLGGDVDLRQVFVGEEGSVAVVRPRKESIQGDAEASLRRLLSQLLEASGSQTPALATAARRRAGAGLPSLVAELEAALIPVNRAAGRRALARLSREVRRVTLGLGRNALAPLSERLSERLPERRATPMPPNVGIVTGTPPPAAVYSGAYNPGPISAPSPSRESITDDFDPDRARTARRPVPAELLSEPGLPSGGAPSRPTPSRPSYPSFDRGAPDRSPPRGGTDEVDHLLASFEVSERGTDKEASRRLKELVGLEATPEPATPEPRTVARKPPGPMEVRRATSAEGRRPGFDPRASATETDIEALLAMGDASPGPGPVAAPYSSPAPGAAPASAAPASPGLARRHPLATETRSEVFVGPQPGLPVPRSTPVPPAHRGSAERAPAYEPLPDAGRADAPRRPDRSGPVERIPASAGGATTFESSQPRTAVSAQRRARSRVTDALLVGGILVVLAGGAALLFFAKPGFLSGRTPEVVEAERAEAERARLAAAEQAAAPACKATLTVTDAPPHSEVLLRVGHAPADIERMPVGTRLEFVAVLDGHRAKRAVIPAGASWDRGPDGRPRYEVAVQLDAAPKRGASADLWPAAEPGSEVGGKGPPGTVHVVSTPRGAEVWLLAGVGPEAVIEQLRCQEPIDVLVAGPTTYRKRLRVKPEDFKPAPDGTGAKVAKISVKGER